MRRALAPAVIIAVLIVGIIGTAGAYAATAGLGGTATSTGASLGTTVGLSASTSISAPAVTTTLTGVPTTTVTDNFSTTVTGFQTTETVASSYTTTQFSSSGDSDLIQSCAARGDADQTVSCGLPSAATSGDILLVEVAEVPVYPPISLYNSTTGGQTTSTGSVQPVTNLSDSLGDRFTLIGSAGQNGSTYVLDFFIANVTSTDTDNVTLTGVGNYPFLLVHELQNIDHVVAFSTGTGNSTSPSVTPYVAPSGSFVFAGVFVLNDSGVMAANVTAGSGNTFVDTTYGIADEYNDAGGPTTSPFVISAVIPWGEVSVAFN
jgi:hypothetical protein